MATEWSDYVDFPESIEIAERFRGKKIYVTLGSNEIFTDDAGLALTGKASVIAFRKYMEKS